jgi:hypothetical protein
MSNPNKGLSIDASNYPSFDSFCQAVSEIDLPETRIAYGGHVCKQIRTK